MTETQMPVDELLDDGGPEVSASVEGNAAIDDDGIVTITTKLGSASIVLKYDSEDKDLIADTGLIAIDVLLIGLPQAVAQLIDALAAKADGGEA